MTIQIAAIIADQLGGTRKLKLMINAKDFLSCDSGKTLQFKFSGCRKMNCVQITLNCFDTYDLKFKKITRKKSEFKVSDVASISNVYADQLIPIFERETGLYLSI